VLNGSLLELDRNFAAARAEYEIALQKSPQPSQVLGALVRVDLSDKQPQKAVARLTAFLEKTPDDPLANQLLGEVRLSQAEYHAALGSFDRAIKSNSKWWMPYRGKAMTHDADKHPDLALKVLAEGLANTESIELGMELAARQERLGQHDAAIGTYEQLLKRTPKSLPLANNLAMILVNRRSDAASLDRADKLAEVLTGSEEAPFLDTRGWIKFRRGDLQAAMPLLQKAAEKSPQSPEIRYHLGMAQYRVGNKDAARQSLEAAMATKAQFSGIDEARTTLSALDSRG
jgi:tetratricopeptide (TPR) repeat protein